MNTIQSRATIFCVQERFPLYRLYNELSMLQEEYPDFEKWFFGKVIPETLSKSNKRKVFTAYCENNLAGILITKDAEEKKICTLRVLPNYRNLGIGHQLMDCAIKTLNLAKPLITVSDCHIDEFSNLFREYDFNLTEFQYGLYRENHLEYVFNGSLNHT